MQVITPDLVKNKKVLLRMDLDVPLRLANAHSGSMTPQADQMEVADDFRLKAALPTLELCLENASEVIIMGHIGRPRGEIVPELSVGPIYDWFWEIGEIREFIENKKLRFLENLRFEEGESFDSAQDHGTMMEYANKLAQFGNFYINEAFAAYHSASSTTVLPTLLPHCAGLRFAQEVEILTKVRENPEHPLVVIIGGVKVEDKLPVVLAMAGLADWVLVGGKIASEISEHLRGVPQAPHHLGGGTLPANILLGKLNEEGIDITDETVKEWEKIIRKAKTIVWNGPLGKVEEEKNDQSRKIAQIILDCQAFSVVGGGDTVGYLGKLGLLERFEKKGFVSTGGGAMLKFLVKGTLPAIEALR